MAYCNKTPTTSIHLSYLLPSPNVSTFFLESSAQLLSMNLPLLMVQKPWGHQLGVVVVFPYLQGFVHPRWCRISEPSTVSSMWSCVPFPTFPMNKSDSTPSNCEGCVKGACKSTASSLRFKHLHKLLSPFWVWMQEDTCSTNSCKLGHPVCMNEIPTMCWKSSYHQTLPIPWGQSKWMGWASSAPVLS